MALAYTPELSARAGHDAGAFDRQVVLMTEMLHIEPWMRYPLSVQVLSPEFEPFLQGALPRGDRACRGPVLMLLPIRRCCKRAAPSCHIRLIRVRAW